MLSNVTALCGALDNIATQSSASNDTLRQLRATQLILDFIAGDDLYCQHVCLRSAFHRNFATLLDLTDALSETEAPEVLGMTATTMTQFVSIAEFEDDESTETTDDLSGSFSRQDPLQNRRTTV